MQLVLFQLSSSKQKGATANKLVRLTLLCFTRVTSQISLWQKFSVELPSEVSRAIKVPADRFRKIFDISELKRKLTVGIYWGLLMTQRTETAS